jgi:hypothetical protein
MKKIFVLLVLVALVLSSCAKAGVSVQGVAVPSGADFEMSFLFEVDGCKVYRFRDAGHWRYFSTGNGRFQGQMQIRSSRKTRTSWIDGTEGGI